MSLTYTTYVSTLANLVATDSTNTEFQQILPSCIDYAEQRCYRELDLLNTVVTQTGTLTASNRQFTLPSASGRFVVTNGINVLPTGNRVALVAVSVPVMNLIWPSSTGSAQPKFYAMLTDQVVILGPTPDQAYSVEVLGTIRPAPISSTNATTFLSNYLPDLFLAASMIFMSGYKQNFGQQSDDPAMAASWESQYGKLLSSANLEEQRKKGVYVVGFEEGFEIEVLAQKLYQT